MENTEVDKDKVQKTRGNSAGLWSNTANIWKSIHAVIIY